MSKKVILTIVGIVLIIFLSIFFYNSYQFENISDQPYSLSREIKDSYKHISVFDEVLYFVEGEELVAIDIENKEIFSKKIGKNLQNIIYDKYIYLVYEKQIDLLNRRSGKLIRTVSVDEKIDHFEKNESNMIAYFKKSINIYDLKLIDVEKLTFDSEPVTFSQNASKKSLAFIESNQGRLSSTYRVYDKDEIIYEISSQDEVFMETGFFNDNLHFALTNRYLYLFDNSKLINKVMVFSPRAISFENQEIALVDDRQLRIFDSNLTELSQINLSFYADNIAARANSMVLIGEGKLSVYENSNVMESDIKNAKLYVINDSGVYIIFSDKVEKVKAY